MHSLKYKVTMISLLDYHLCLYFEEFTQYASLLGKIDPILSLKFHQLYFPTLSEGHCSIMSCSLIYIGLNSSQIPYHGSFVDMTNKNSSGSLNVIGDEENDGWGYFIIVANSRALVLLGESNSKSYSFGTRTTRLPKIPSTIFIWNEDN